MIKNVFPADAPKEAIKREPSVCLAACAALLPYSDLEAEVKGLRGSGGQDSRGSVGGEAQYHIKFHYMTRIILAAFALALSTTLCYAQPKPLTAVGAKDSAGRPIGDYRIINTRGGTQAQGRFEAGQMAGQWTFWDSRGTRTAQIRYRGSQPAGEYRLYFSALAFPAAAGHLKAQGQMVGGHIAGQHVGYGLDGSVVSRAVFAAGGAIKASAGSAEQARALAEADYRLFEGLKQSVQGSLQ